MALVMSWVFGDPRVVSQTMSSVQAWRLSSVVESRLNLRRVSAANVGVAKEAARTAQSERDVRCIVFQWCMNV